MASSIEAYARSCLPDPSDLASQSFAGPNDTALLRFRRCVEALVAALPPPPARLSMRMLLRLLRCGILLSVTEEAKRQLLR